MCECMWKNSPALNSASFDVNGPLNKSINTLFNEALSKVMETTFFSMPHPNSNVYIFSHNTKVEFEAGMNQKFKTLFWRDQLLAMNCEIPILLWMSTGRISNSSIQGWSATSSQVSQSLCYTYSKISLTVFLEISLTSSYI